MLKNISTLEEKVGERVYRFLCETDSPLGEVHDVICKMKSFIVQRINQAHEVDTPKEKIVELDDLEDQLNEAE
jgi:hypothetical protein